MTIVRDSSGNGISVSNPLNVTIAGANASGGNVNTNLNASSIIQPIDVQSHLQQTIQTHNAVSVGASSSSIPSSYFDSDGFTDIGVTLTNDANVSSSVDISWSNDGTNEHGKETVIVTGTPTRRSGLTSTKARYYKIILNNADTVAHTMSAWAYLKA